MLRPRGRFERLGFWILVAAAVVVLLGAAAVLVPVLFRTIGWGLAIGAAFAALTMLNTRQLAGWANQALGRRVFPLLNGDDATIRRLVMANAVLGFGYGLLLALLPFGPVVSTLLIGGVLTVGGMLAAQARAGRALRHPTATPPATGDRDNRAA